MRFAKLSHTRGMYVYVCVFVPREILGLGMGEWRSEMCVIW